MQDVDWVHAAWLVILTFLTAAMTIVAAATVLVTLPSTYFLKNHRGEREPGRHPILRGSGRILKNVCGAALVLLGMILALPGVPGQREGEVVQGPRVLH